MRIAFGGSISNTEPVVLIFTSNATFYKSDYADYTNYDVIAIGAGGGLGGGCAGTDTNHPTYHIRNYGGAGGGGGFHRVQGLLSILDSAIDIVIGVPGADGIDGVSDPSDTTDGEDGTFSHFGSFCEASGGTGGKRAVSCSIDENLESYGGDGGMGGQTDPGHGGLGATAGIVLPSNTPGTPGSDGILQMGPYEFAPGEFTLPGQVGGGGGGGAGGIARSISPFTDWAGHLPWATASGKGSFDSDEAVFGPAGPTFLDPDHYMAIGPGRGGGARITPFNRSNTVYGNSGQPGVVALLLTKEV